jgi:uncharacterized OsmC-like protein
MTSEVLYTGQLRTECTHLKSGNKITTDAPTDNHGKGEFFSPTDLVATALASCIITTVGIVVDQGRLPQMKMRAEVQKNMVDAPRRIGSIDINLYVSGATLTDEEKQKLERIAHTCPVAKSLHPEMLQNVQFYYS